MEKPARDKIIEASLKLFTEKGFKGATTKKIASEAGVNELTVFRYFGSKENILREVILSRHLYLEHTIETLKKTLKYDPEIDLQLLSHLYFDSLLENINFVMTELNEFDMDSDINTLMSQIPLDLKAFLFDYFEELKRRKIISDLDSEFASTMFMSLNIGFLLLYHKLKNNFTSLSAYDFLDKNMKILSDSILRG
jgi:AcrR family transcriptional regulator